VLDDGTPFPQPSRDPELFYHPTTHPGARMPHAWVQHGTEMVSTLDLAGHGRFSLLVGIGGEPWREAAEKVAVELDLEIAVHAVGYRCEYDDVLGQWSKLREIGDGGCLLVRPDQHIAFRSADLPDQPLDTLRDALTQVLGR
jgi:2,4-dichlorophenol 6-monooxygenase